MIPIKDRNPTLSFPLVTVILIIVNIIVFLYELSLPGHLLKNFLLKYGAIPLEITSFIDINPTSPIPLPFTMFTAMFLHGGFLHIAGNMLYLWIFGNNVEDNFGKKRFIIFYFTCGLFASTLHIIINPTSPLPMIGASGAISGVIGAYMLLYPFARVDTVVIFFIFIRIVPLPAFLFIILWFLMQLMGASSMSGNIAWFAHIGGFVAGIILTPFMRRRRFIAYY